MLPLGRFLLLALTALCCGAFAGESQPASSDVVSVDPTRTSIYIGTVSLTMPGFVRRGDFFESTYDCKVFPYFFSNEHGTLRIQVPEADLAALRQGQPIDFRGEARNHRDAERGVEGRATPESATEGRLKVRVRVSRRIELIFNTRYRFEMPATRP